ncbi:hypothetical protein [Lignipirellula cremea]|uniref:Uncharacterized protein n=1 Tax=Lignipirellula cremea TaxID=2528010 RepID=A0A518DKY5_9BACT|nr:hypothetical protein [Lignipirellula cremea]QDU92503.1 hypothetical protein Pla8534_02510 [Lignipirellula cremea]
MISVTVEYAASQPVADAASLEQVLQTKIEQHLQSLSRPVIHNADLTVCVESMELKANFGRVVMSLKGPINHTVVCETVISTDRPADEDYQTSESDRFVMQAFQNFFTLFFRMLRPSPLGSAIGSIRTNGRLLRALEEGLAEIRIAINSALGTPESSGGRDWSLAKRRALIGGLGAAGIAAAVFLMRRAQVADEIRALFGCGLIGVSIAGVVLGIALVRLPDCFYLSDQAGRRVVKLAGVKSPGAIRAVGAGIVLLGAAFTAAGIYWIVFE